MHSQVSSCQQLLFILSCFVEDANKIMLGIHDGKFKSSYIINIASSYPLFGKYFLWMFISQSDTAKVLS